MATKIGNPENNINKKIKKPPVTQGATPHYDEALATALARNILKKETFQYFYKTIYSLIILCIVSLLFVIYLISRPVEYRYFTIDSNGRTKEIIALNKPSLDSAQILNWSSNALVKAYNIDYANYKQQIDDMKQYFTDSGWTSFKNAIEKDGVVETILKQNLVLTSVVSKAPIIVNEGLVGNVWGWHIQIPLVLTYSSASQSQSQNKIIDVVVVRRSEDENPVGLGIEQILTN